MSRFNTGNPLGSGDPRDLDDNAKNMDLAVNSDELRWSDRFGRGRKSFEGMEREFDADQAARESEFESAQNSREARFNDFIASSGYQFLGDYAAGLEFTEYNQLVRDENGEFWRLSGQVELPYTTTGGGIPEDDALVPAGDAVLRQNLANPELGVSLLARGVAAAGSRAEAEALPETFLRPDLRLSIQGTTYRIGLDRTLHPEGPENIMAYATPAAGLFAGVPIYFSQDIVLSGVPEGRTGTVVEGNGRIVHQPAPSTSCIIHVSNDDNVSGVSYYGIRFTQDKSTPIIGGLSNNHAMLKMSGVVNGNSVLNSFNGQYGISFGMGDASLPDRRGRFNLALGNYASEIQGMFIENIGSSYNAVVGNRGDAGGAVYHGIRLAGYSTAGGDATDAPCLGVVGSANTLRGFARGVSIQNSSRHWNLTSMYFEDVDFGIQTTLGTGDENHPRLGISSFTARNARKLMAVQGASHSEFEVVADASDVTSPAIEELALSGALGHNSYRGIIKDSAQNAVQLRYSHNRINLTVDGTAAGSGVIITGHNNTGVLVVTNAASQGVLVNGNNNNLTVTSGGSGQNDLAVNGSDNVITVNADGNIVVNGSGNKISGRVGGTVTVLGSGHDLRGIRGFSGSGRVTATTDSNGEVQVSLGKHPSATVNPVFGYIGAVPRWANLVSVSGDTATVLVVNADGSPAANTSVSLRWVY